MPSKYSIEERKHPRKPYNPRSSTETFIGVSINISDSGICLYTFTITPFFISILRDLDEGIYNYFE